MINTPVALRPGDLFATRNPQGLGKAINVAQKIWATDSQSKYGHVGVVQTERGLTLEALWTISEQNLFIDYAGAEVLIARPINADLDPVKQALADVKGEHLDQIYPFWRLLLHMIPPLARRVSLGGHYVVCSELVAKYLHLAGLRHGQYMGTNPDTLVDEWRHWRGYKIIFEGRLPGKF